MENPNLIDKKELRKVLNKIGIGFIVYCFLVASLFLAYEYAMNTYAHYFDLFILESIDLSVEIISSLIIYILPFYLVTRLVKITKVKAFKVTKIKVNSLLAYTCMLISMYFFIIFMFSGLIAVFGFETLTINPYFYSANLIISISYAIYFLLILPFLEEYIFRGVILQLTSKFGASFAMICTSLLYALFLLGRADFITSFVMGLLLALIAMMYQSALPTVMMRIGLNAMVLVSLYIPQEYSWIFGLLTIIVYGYTFFYLIKNMHKQIVFKETLPKKMTWSAFFTSFLLMVAIILLILKGIYYIVY